jgi:hypothetical protein
MRPILASAIVPMDQSVIGRLYQHFGGVQASTEARLVLIAALAVLTHLAVRVIKRISDWIALRISARPSRLGFVTDRSKVLTLHSLVVSCATFSVYFLAVGLALQELGVNLTAYLAGASVIGLAISFGLQSLVQDIIVGMTMIMSDAMNVGDLVEIAGAVTVVGRVERIGFRFTELSNLFNQRVLVTNRTIANVSRFSNGGVDALADIWLPAGADPRVVGDTLRRLGSGMRAQFREIILADVEVSGPFAPEGGSWSFVRVHFRIWPGQGALIETTFRQEVVRAMRAFDPTFAEWQVPVTYRAEARQPAEPAAAAKAKPS